jgi:hypothetical protein
MDASGPLRKHAVGLTGHPLTGGRIKTHFRQGPLLCERARTSFEMQ